MKIPTNETKPPAGLSPDACMWWTRLTSEYDLSDASAQILLESALRAFDRWKIAEKTLKREGSFVRDRFGQCRAHPATIVCRDAQSTMATALKQLHLDIEPLHDRPGRPGGK